jgi:hypothetical protein
LPTVLIAVPNEVQTRLQGTFFWRSDMRRTLAQPDEILPVARTLGPDVILVLAGPPDRTRAIIDEIRNEAVTRDSVVVVLSERPDELADLKTGAGPNLILPQDFGDGEGAPWHDRVEALLQVRRRRETRVSTEFPVDVWIEQPGPRQKLSARGLNLSSRGVLLELTSSIAPATRLEVTFVAAKGLPEISVVGEVVRVAKTADERVLAGVHFVVVRKDARLAIRDTLRALRPSEPPEAD